MKTTIALLALASTLFITTNSNAQKHSNFSKSSLPYHHTNGYNGFASGTGWTLGGELMLNKTVYSYNGAGFGSFSPGFFAVANYTMNQDLGFTFKAGYDNKQLSDVTNGVTASASIDYLNLVSLVRYSVTPQYFIAAGPVLNFSMGLAKVTVGVNGQSQSAMANVAVPTRFGFSLETGYQVPVSPTVSIVPVAGYDYFFTGETSDGIGRLNNLHLSARVQCRVD